MTSLDDFRYRDGPGAERQERLKYLADLIGEMEQMAVREGCEQLSKMLALCRAEAIREAMDDAQVGDVA